MMLSNPIPIQLRRKVVTPELKSIEESLDKIRGTPDDNVYYTLTLDPSLRDHRVIALLVDYTSRTGECPYYRMDLNQRHCTIAPDFTIMWKDCEGKCFVCGIACPIIADRESKTEESSYSRSKTR